MWIATKRRCCMCSTSIVSESRKPPALLIRGGGRIIIDCRRRIYWNRSIVGENMAEYGHVRFHAYLWDLEPPGADLLKSNPNASMEIRYRDSIVDAAETR